MIHDGRDVGAFIPAELDDYPLTPGEFRVYCRIVRRAGADGCYESNAKMGAALGLGERTVREAKALLVAAGLVSVEKREGLTDRYRLTPSSEWADGSTVSEARLGTRRPRKDTPVPRTAVTRTGDPGPQDRPTPVPRTDEGTTREGSTSKGARRSPARPLPDDWTPNDTHRSFCAEHRLDLDEEAARFRDHAEANDRRQVSWDAAFRNWLRNARNWSPKAEARTDGVLDMQLQRDRGEACPECNGRRHVLDEDGVAWPCPRCR